MNYSIIIHVVSGLLLFGVACYALRLGSFFVTARVRGSVFAGLSLLTVLYLFFSSPPADSIAASRVEIVYALFSALLLAAMAHMEILAAERIRGKAAHSRSQARSQAEHDQELEKLVQANEGWAKAYQELQQKSERVQVDAEKFKIEGSKLKIELSKVKADADKFKADAEKLKSEASRLRTESAAPDAQAALAAQEKALAELAEQKAQFEQLAQSNTRLTEANEELQKSVSALQSEVTEHKNSVTKLIEANEGLAGANRELLQTTAGLQEQVMQHKRTREQIEAEYQEVLASSRPAPAAPPVAPAAPPSPAPATPRPHTASLRSIENLLDSVHVSVSSVTQNLSRSRMSRINQLSRHLPSRPNGLREASNGYTRSRRMPAPLAQLAKQLSEEQVLLVKAMKSVKQKIQRIQQIIAAEVTNELSTTLSVAPAAPEAAERNGEYALQCGATETGTNPAEETDRPGAAPEDADDADDTRFHSSAASF